MTGATISAETSLCGKQMPPMCAYLLHFHEKHRPTAYRPPDKSNQTKAAEKSIEARRLEAGAYPSSSEHIHTYC